MKSERMADGKNEDTESDVC